MPRTRQLSAATGVLLLALFLPSSSRRSLHGLLGCRHRRVRFPHQRTWGCQALRLRGGLGRGGRDQTLTEMEDSDGLQPTAGDTAKDPRHNEGGDEEYEQLLLEFEQKVAELDGQSEVQPGRRRAPAEAAAARAALRSDFDARFEACFADIKENQELALSELLSDKHPPHLDPISVALSLRPDERPGAGGGGGGQGPSAPSRGVCLCLCACVCV
jgi:hypothetical protein